MANQEYLEKMQLRQSYRNVWHTDLMNSIQADCPSCCLALWCGPCVSYLLRKRALYNDMSRYVCCAGIYHVVANVGKVIAQSFVFALRCFYALTQHKVELDKRDGKFGPSPVMAVPPMQQMSRFDQPIPPNVGYPPQQGYG